MQNYYAGYEDLADIYNDNNHVWVHSRSREWLLTLTHPLHAHIPGWIITQGWRTIEEGPLCFTVLKLAIFGGGRQCIVCDHSEVWMRLKVEPGIICDFHTEVFQAILSPEQFTGNRVGLGRKLQDSRTSPSWQYKDDVTHKSTVEPR